MSCSLDSCHLTLLSSESSKSDPWYRTKYYWFDAGRHRNRETAFATAMLMPQVANALPTGTGQCAPWAGCTIGINPQMQLASPTTSQGRWR